MSDTEKPALERRSFLKITAVGTATALGVAFKRYQASHASGPAGKGEYSWAMVIDQAKCTGCGYCTLTCQAHNDVPPEIEWNRVIVADEVDGDTVFLARPCQHCDYAPCIGVCPVKASYKRSDGIVMMDYERCIGCRYCEVSCPYGARAFNWREFTGPNPVVPDWGIPEVKRRPRGVVEKCSFCYQRIDRGLTHGLTPGIDTDATPACVVVCPVGARTFGNLNDPDSEINRLLAENPHVRLREDMGNETRVYYLPARG